MRKNIVIAVLVLIVVVLLCTIANMAPSNTKSNASASIQPTATPIPASPTPTPKPPTPTPIPPTPTPTHTPQWTTIQTFSGNGDKKTTLFTVPDTWRLVWSCNPVSNYFGEYNVIVDVKASDGTNIDSGAVNTICKAGVTGDSTQEYQGGTVYLDVTADEWTIKIQVLK